MEASLSLALPNPRGGKYVADDYERDHDRCSFILDRHVRSCHKRRPPACFVFGVTHFSAVVSLRFVLVLILVGWWNWLALISFDRWDLWDPGRIELVGVSSLLWDWVLTVCWFWWLASLSLLLGLFNFAIQVWDPGGFLKHNSLLPWWHAHKVRSFESFRRQLRSCTTIECLGDFCSCVSPSRCVEVL